MQDTIPYLNSRVEALKRSLCHYRVGSPERTRILLEIIDLRSQIRTLTESAESENQNERSNPKCAISQTP